MNPWGLVAGPTTPIWSNDNGTGVSTLCNGAVNGSTSAILPVVVRVPGGLDTGIVFNAVPGFTVDAGGLTDSARFIFATLVGTISGWSPNLPLNGDAQLKATVEGASYTGLANLTTDKGSFLYDRLWALRFGNGVFGDPTDLVFSAGIEDETHGLLGIIEATDR